MKFDATLTNAKPPGEIKSGGMFGPFGTGRSRETLRFPESTHSGMPICLYSRASPANCHPMVHIMAGLDKSRSQARQMFPTLGLLLLIILST